MVSKAKRADKPVIDVFISLGSNIQPRKKYIERALNLLSDNSEIEVDQISSIHETEPVGGPEAQEMYLNAVTKIQTSLKPIDLLDAIQDIEAQLGRKRTVAWGARTIDLDILLYGDEIISSDRLVVPHALMHTRRFVMQPLAQIAPEVMHPILQMSAATISESMGDWEVDDSE